MIYEHAFYRPNKTHAYFKWLLWFDIGGIFWRYSHLSKHFCFLHASESFGSGYLLNYYSHWRFAFSLTPHVIKYYIRLEEKLVKKAIFQNQLRREEKSLSSLIPCAIFGMYCLHSTFKWILNWCYSEENRFWLFSTEKKIHFDEKNIFSQFSSFSRWKHQLWNFRWFFFQKVDRILNIWSKYQQKTGIIGYSTFFPPVFRIVRDLFLFQIFWIFF